MQTVNERGLQEIAEFLAENHKRGSEFTRANLLAWAADAEFQLSEGNPACIEIHASASVNGRTQEYTISDEGLDGCATLDEALDGWHK